MPITTEQFPQFVHWFRSTTPYINTFRGKCFVIYFSNKLLDNTTSIQFLHDIALLHSLGIHLVLVYENHLAPYHTIIDSDLLLQLSNQINQTRLTIEAKIVLSLANSPSPYAKIRIISGNFITSKPYGIHQGIDYLYRGKVRSIDKSAILYSLQHHALVLLPPLGYSSTGETFILSAAEIATRTAMSLQADKLIFLLDDKCSVLHHSQAINLTKLQQFKAQLPSSQHHYIDCITQAVHAHVPRIHILNEQMDGSLLMELFSRDGIGTLISDDPFEHLRKATIQDVAGILELISPLEQQGILVKRSREHLEMEIEYFYLIERDHAIIACAALYPYTSDKGTQLGELACLAVEKSYRSAGRASRLLNLIENNAKQQGIEQLFILTTQTTHWFLERGFQQTTIQQLPLSRQALYNYQRNSAICIKIL